MKKFDNTIFWVDRFSKPLFEKEFIEAPLISYVDTLGNKTDKKIKAEYLVIENKITSFLLDLFLSKSDIKAVKLKYQADQSLSKREMNKLNDWEKGFVEKLVRNWQYIEHPIKDKSELESLIRLSLKEKIKIVVAFSGSYFSSNFDLGLCFQSIEKSFLKKYTDKHSLYILKEWEDNLWTQAE